MLKKVPSRQPFLSETKEDRTHTNKQVKLPKGKARIHVHTNTSEIKKTPLKANKVHNVKKVRQQTKWVKKRTRRNSTFLI